MSNDSAIYSRGLFPFKAATLPLAADLSFNIDVHPADYAECLIESLLPPCDIDVHLADCAQCLIESLFPPCDIWKGKHVGP